MRIRDAIIEKYSETPLDILSGKLQGLITDETDTATRLGIFSARVEILKMRFAELQRNNILKNKLKMTKFQVHEDDDEDEKKMNL